MMVSREGGGMVTQVTGIKEGTGCRREVLSHLVAHLKLIQHCMVTGITNLIFKTLQFLKAQLPY